MLRPSGAYLRPAVSDPGGLSEARPRQPLAPDTPTEPAVAENGVDTAGLTPNLPERRVAGGVHNVTLDNGYAVPE